ncbi:MAG TPA: hypothetical protein VGO67_25100 [Verrucomicrobiae bacterium]
MKATPFSHPDYSALRERSQFLATVWGIGHVFMVVFFAIAIVVPFGVGMIRMVAPDLIEGRTWDSTASCMAAPLLISAIGFAARLYAKKKGEALSKNLDRVRVIGI